MSEKPDLKLIDAAASDDPYDLEQLRIDPWLWRDDQRSQIAADGAGAEAKQTRIHPRSPGPAIPRNAGLHRIEKEREIFAVDLRAVPGLREECFFATLFTAINRAGVVFLWPVKVPVDGEKVLEWHSSAAMAAQHATKAWTRSGSNMSGRLRSHGGHWRIPEPEWPEIPFKDIYRIAFRDKIIRSLDHPVVKRLTSAE